MFKSGVAVNSISTIASDYSEIPQDYFGLDYEVTNWMPDETFEATFCTEEFTVKTENVDNLSPVRFQLDRYRVFTTHPFTIWGTDATVTRQELLFPIAIKTTTEHYPINLGSVVRPSDINSNEFNFANEIRGTAAGDCVKGSLEQCLARGDKFRLCHRPVHVTKTGDTLMLHEPWPYRTLDSNHRYSIFRKQIETIEDTCLTDHEEDRQLYPGMDAFFMTYGTFSLCYRFRDEPWKLYPDINLIVREVIDYTQGHGDLSVMVKDVPKKYTFTGWQLSPKDRIKVVWNPTECDSSDTSALNFDHDGSQDAWHTIGGDTPVGSGLVDVTTELLFTERSSEDQLVYFCYQFWDESLENPERDSPVKGYPFMFLEVVTLTSRYSVDESMRDDLAVQNIDKEWGVDGWGLRDFDEARFTGSDCVEAMDRFTGSLAEGDFVFSQSLEDTDVAGTQGVKIDLCYKHRNEPPHLYSGADFGIYGVYFNYTSTPTGDGDFRHLTMVADRQFDLRVTGINIDQLFFILHYGPSLGSRDEIETIDYSCTGPTVTGPDYAQYEEVFTPTTATYYDGELERLFPFIDTSEGIVDLEFDDLIVKSIDDAVYHTAMDYLNVEHQLNGSYFSANDKFLWVSDSSDCNNNAAFYDAVLLENFSPSDTKVWDYTSSNMYADSVPFAFLFSKGLEGWTLCFKFEGENAYHYPDVELVVHSIEVFELDDDSKTEIRTYGVVGTTNTIRYKGIALAEGDKIGYHTQVSGSTDCKSEDLITADKQVYDSFYESSLNEFDSVTIEWDFTNVGFDDKGRTLVLCYKFEGMSEYVEFANVFLAIVDIEEVSDLTRSNTDVDDIAIVHKDDVKLNYYGPLLTGSSSNKDNAVWIPFNGCSGEDCYDECQNIGGDALPASNHRGVTVPNTQTIRRNSYHEFPVDYEQDTTLFLCYKFKVMGALLYYPFPQYTLEVKVMNDLSAVESPEIIMAGTEKLYGVSGSHHISEFDNMFFLPPQVPPVPADNAACRAQESAATKFDVTSDEDVVLYFAHNAVGSYALCYVFEDEDPVYTGISVDVANIKTFVPAHGSRTTLVLGVPKRFDFNFEFVTDPEYFDVRLAKVPKNMYDTIKPWNDDYSRSQQLDINAICSQGELSDYSVALSEDQVGRLAIVVDTADDIRTDYLDATTFEPVPHMLCFRLGSANEWRGFYYLNSPSKPTPYMTLRGIVAVTSEPAQFFEGPTCYNC